MRFLLLHGAELDARNRDDNTALLQATDEGQLQAVRFLLEHGANVHAINRFGSDAVWLTGRTEQPGAENAPAIRKLLLEHIRQEKQRHKVRMRF
jgi:DNA-binding SARP family transcriptional activator